MSRASRHQSISRTLSDLRQELLFIYLFIIYLFMWLTPREATQSEIQGEIIFRCFKILALLLLLDTMIRILDR